VVHALVLVDADVPRIAPLGEDLAATEGVTEVFSAAGGFTDIIAIVRVRRHEELADVVTKRIAALDGIQETTTLVAFQAYSRHDLETMWDSGPA
jgi:DNA-binding Lrp family transcriptional regulator